MLFFVSKGSEILFLCIIVSIPHCFPIWTKQSPICRMIMTFCGMYLHCVKYFTRLISSNPCKSPRSLALYDFPSSDEENKAWKGSAIHHPVGSGRTMAQTWQLWALDSALNHTSLLVEWTDTIRSVSSLFLIKQGNRSAWRTGHHHTAT